MGFMQCHLDPWYHQLCGYLFYLESLMFLAFTLFETNGYWSLTLILPQCILIDNCILEEVIYVKITALCKDDDI